MMTSQENRHRRGWILRILKYHSADMNDKLILQALGAAGHHVSMAILHGDLTYLDEKGYVECSTPDLPLDFDMKVVRLTAKGVDILEENITDVGIDLGHK